MKKVPLQKVIIAAVRNSPGIGPSPIADALGRDKSQTRRAMRDLARRGYLAEQSDGYSYAYFPVGGRTAEPTVDQIAGPISEDTGLHLTDNEGVRDLNRRSNSNQDNVASAPIDVAYGDVTPPSTSRSLVPIEQPYDSRTDQAVRQHAARAKVLARLSQGPRIGGETTRREFLDRMANGQPDKGGRQRGQFVSTLDQLYAIDPTGKLTRSAIERAGAGGTCTRAGGRPSGRGEATRTKSGGTMGRTRLDCDQNAGGFSRHT